jgi:integrase
MSEPHPTAPAEAVKPAKPSKPYPEFPLFPHAAGVWAKKIRGRLHYFGPWDDPDGALNKYDEQKEALHAGRKVRESTEGNTVHDLVNRFLNQKAAFLDAGELSPRTWRDYKEACDAIVAAFGKRRLLSDIDTDDFAGLRNKLAQKWGPHRLSKTIQFVRCVFKFAFDDGLVAVPVRFGPGFKRPSKKTIRLHRAKAGAKLFTAEEIRRLLAAAVPQIKAMILLGINCGFGNADCALLPRTVIDLNAGLIDYARPKTGIPRRCPLWPETVQALKDALAARPEPKNAEDSELAFLTRLRVSWHKDTPDNPISRELGKLLKRLNFNGRKGLGFYTLRHTFRTVADEARDQPAADYIMGHEVPHMSAVYRETISDERLRAVVNHVHAWLFPAQGKAEKATTDAGPGGADEPQQTPKE